MRCARIIICPATFAAFMVFFPFNASSADSCSAASEKTRQRLTVLEEQYKKNQSFYTDVKKEGEELVSGLNFPEGEKAKGVVSEFNGKLEDFNNENENFISDFRKIESSICKITDDEMVALIVKASASAENLYNKKKELTELFFRKVKIDLQSLAKTWKSEMDEARKKVENFVKNTEDRFVSDTKNAKDRIENDLKNNKDRVENDLENTKDRVENDLENNKDRVENDLENTKDRVENDLENTKDRVENDLENTKDRVENDLENTKDRVENDLENTKDRVENDLENTKDRVENDLENTKDRIENDTENFFEDALKGLEKMNDFTKDFFDKSFEYLVEKPAKLIKKLF